MTTDKEYRQRELKQFMDSKHSLYDGMAEFNTDIN